MSDTIRKIHPASRKVRIFGDLMPVHQIAVKAIDVPRGLYEPTGRGDAWGQCQTRFLKTTRRRRDRRAGRRIVAAECGLMAREKAEAERQAELQRDAELQRLAREEADMYRWDEYKYQWREDFGML